MNEKLSEMLMQPLVTGALAAVGASMAGISGQVADMIPLPLFLGATSVAGSLAAQSLKQYVIPYIDNQDSKLISGLVSPVLTGAATCAFLYPAFGLPLSDPIMYKSFGVSAGAEMLASYAYDNLMKESFNKSAW